MPLQAGEEGGGAAGPPARHPADRDQVAGGDQDHRGEHAGPGLRLADQLPEIQRREVHLSTVARRVPAVPTGRRRVTGRSPG
jgi:hypothetical protein